MTSLEDKLEAIAHMMDPSRERTREEILVWRALIHHVDRETFERTGRIVVTATSLEALVGRTVPRLTTHSVEEAIQNLSSRGLVEHEPGETLTYKLFLAPERADFVTS